MSSNSWSFGRAAIAGSILVAALCGTAKGAADHEHQGSQVYLQARCFACHGNLGTGTLGPSLQGDRLLNDTSYVVAQILLGRQEMPSFANRLSNAEIAAVADYIRNSWGNSFGPVSGSDVAKARQMLEKASKETKANPAQMVYPQR